MNTEVLTKDPEYTRIDEMLNQVTSAKPLTAIVDIEADPEQKVVHVSSPWDIIRAVEDAEEHTCIVIAKGRYVMPRDFVINTNHLTIRG